jgi:DNA-binding NarL/FixJ family response regulator
MTTILIIEDEESARKICRKILGEQHTIIEACNSDDGIKLLIQARPDLVITDLMLPNSSGIFPTGNGALDIITSLRLIDNKVKIVVYSGLSQEANIHKQVLSLGANACLPKNGSITELRQTISSLLGLTPI